MRTRVFVALLLLFPCACGCARKVSPGEAPPVEGPAAAGPQRETVENPLYTSWAGFAKGTSVRHKSVTETEGNGPVTTTTTTYTLVERTDDRVVVEMKAFTRQYDGTDIDNPPERLTNPKRVSLPPGTARADFGNPAGVTDRGEETITAGGKEYRTKWYKGKDRSEAGEVLVQVWTSDEVPGGLVRSVTRTPAIGKKTTVEAVEVKAP